MTRPATSSFAPRAEVFPGGSVDTADLDPSWSELEAGPLLSREVERHLLVTAVRETFEECGILLARTSSGQPCPQELAAELGSLRRRLQAGHPGEFQSRLRRTGLRPGWEDLIFCAHWVTPEGLPRIFDTRFFLAALPAGQEPSREEPGELTAMRWVSPYSALQEAVQGRTLLLPPTRSVLELLVQHRTVEAALQAARGTRKMRVQPKLEEITSARYPGLDVGDLLGPKSESGE
ncbi:MAG: hypothetical protein WBZ07_08530 [Candidatus Dormiibacterota bacterium]